MATYQMQEVEVEGKKEMRPVDTKSGRVMFSKSQASTAIYRQEVENEDGEGSLRQRYIARVMDELGMSKSGASTYFYNEREQASGGYKYKHNKNSAERKKAKEAEAKATEEATVEQAEQKTEEAKEVHRWQVVLADTRELVDSFTGRAAAQKFNKEQKEAGKATVMVDGNKEKKSA